MPGLDVVVVNYMTAVDLDGFLRSLVEHLPRERELDVWIVNVSPGPEDLSMIEAWRDLRTGWHLVEFDENVGYNVAANAAGAEGHHEIVAIFNADVRLSAGSLDVMCDELMAHDDWAIAGPRQFDDRGRFTAAGIFGTDVKPRHRGWHETAGHTDIRDDCTTVSGAALFIKRAMWDELTDCPVFSAMHPEASGPWLPTHHFYGDTGLCYHARGHGWKLGYVGTTTIVHKLHGAGRKAGNMWTKADLADFRAFCDSHELAHE